VNDLMPVAAVTSNLFTPDTAGFTAADISADGRLVLVKNRLDVFAWLRDPGETVEAALARAPQSVCPGTPGVGEAIAIRPDGSGYAMVREGSASPVWTVPMVVPPAAWTCGGFVPNLLGTTGHDLLLGGPGRDVVMGRDGDDVVVGASGDDHLCGGAGTDLLVGAEGDDVLHGNDGDDFLSGGPGADRLFGQAGADVFDTLWPDVVVDEP
jgi:Ca2+-binding RTX toxin-like protein